MTVASEQENTLKTDQIATLCRDCPDEVLKALLATEFFSRSVAAGASYNIAEKNDRDGRLTITADPNGTIYMFLRHNSASVSLCLHPADAGYQAAAIFAAAIVASER